MMKKRLLMPLLVAGVMVASVAILDSCKKTNSDSGSFTTVIRDKDGSPLIDMVYNTPIQFIICPYCKNNPTLSALYAHHDTVYTNDTMHFHTFGSKIIYTETGIDTIYGQFPVDHCLIAYDNDEVCDYSGHYYAETGYDWHFAPRYHAHRVCRTSNLPPWHNGTHNEWHVGGGVEDGWPAPYNPDATPNP